MFRRHRTHFSWPVCIIICILGGSIITANTITSMHQYEAQSEQIHAISRVAPEDIATVQLGKECTFPQSTFGDVIAAIKTLQPFQPNHDFGEHLGLLRITLKAGQIYRINLSTHAHGTIFEFFSADDGNAYEEQGYITYFIYGYSISPIFPHILQEVQPVCP